MTPLQRFAASSPRLLYALWNGATIGLLLTIILLAFFWSMIADGGFWIFIILPTLCAAISGIILGRQLLDPSHRAYRTKEYPVGFLAAIVAFLFYIPALGFPMLLSARRMEFDDSLSILLIILACGLCVVLPIAVLNGISGWMLRRRARPSDNSGADARHDIIESIED